MGAPPASFSLPEGGETYSRDIIQRCEELIQSHIWHGLDVAQLRAWFGNFDGPLETYFASCLLDALVYRSAPQTTALMFQLFQRSLPDLARASELRTFSPQDWVVALASRYDDPGVRIVPVIKTSDPPTKSGPLVCRLLKRHLSLSEKWMIWPTEIAREIKRGIRVFLFVDDFLGTGYQFRRFDQFANLKGHVEATRTCFIYAPLIAFQKGMHRLARQLPHISFTCAECLDESYCLFSATSCHFSDGVNTADLARTFYQQLLARLGMANLGKFTFGYSRLSLAIAFEHATPNASLPLFWADHHNFRPLFQR